MNVGIRSFKEFHIGDKQFDIKKFRSYVEHGVFNFWRAVEMSFYGLWSKKKKHKFDIGYYHNYREY